MYFRLKKLFKWDCVFTKKTTALILVTVLALFYVSCGDSKNVNGEVLTDGTFSDGNTKIVGKDSDICKYKIFPLELAVDKDKLYKINTPPRADKYTFFYNIKSVSPLAHDKESLEQLNLPDSKYTAEMFINVSFAFKKDSVDLKLESVEPTVWVLKGNILAVRRVFVLGKHCSTVVNSDAGAGVESSSITIVTEEFQHKAGKNEELFSKVIKETVEYGQDIGRVFVAQ